MRGGEVEAGGHCGRKYGKDEVKERLFDLSTVSWTQVWLAGVGSFEKILRCGSGLPSGLWRVLRAKCVKLDASNLEEVLQPCCCQRLHDVPRHATLGQ